MPGLSNTFDNQDAQEALRRCLHNLGYPEDGVLQDNEAAFRRDYGFDTDTEIESILGEWHDDPDTVKPKQKPQES